MFKAVVVANIKNSVDENPKLVLVVSIRVIATVSHLGYRSCTDDSDLVPIAFVTPEE